MCALQEYIYINSIFGYAMELTMDWAKAPNLSYLLKFMITENNKLRNSFKRQTYQNLSGELHDSNGNVISVSLDSFWPWHVKLISYLLNCWAAWGWSCELRTNVPHLCFSKNHVGFWIWAFKDIGFWDVKLMYQHHEMNC